MTLTSTDSDRTPGRALEERLNREYGPGNPLYEEMCEYVRQGLEEGWVANIELDGAKYRRSKICLPSEANRYFSVTAVYMDSEVEYSGYVSQARNDSEGVPHLSHSASQFLKFDSSLAGNLVAEAQANTLIITASTMFIHMEKSTALCNSIGLLS